MSTLVETWKISDDHYRIVITTKHRWNNFHYYFNNNVLICQYDDPVTGKSVEWFKSEMVIDMTCFWHQHTQEKDQVMIDCFRLDTYNEELIHSEVIK